ncbi:MAG: N-carbamoyl-D-amino acid hydrolase [Ignavibacteriaceae bacterium]|nr:N-carbamoyl-D-amino acid hydrolase [Ignavibacteriaceae bacterium]MCK6615061.1 carbon-nitrogen hydrolase [Ignavibacteriaceae bacterium]
MSSKKYTIGLIQMQVSPLPEENMKKGEHFVREAAAKGAQVICLPELYRSQYFCQKEDIELFDFAETIPGPSTELFGKLASELGVSIVVPLFEKRGIGLYHNSLVVMDSDGSSAGIYRKMHIPDDPAYYEKFYFTPGDLGFKSFDTKFGKVGTLICWDQWYPEGARLTALTGATVLFYPTAIGWHPYEKEEHGQKQRDAWMTVQRGHAVANGIYVAGVNRVGFEQPVKEQAGIQFWGSSFVADPQGHIIAQASDDKEEILLAEVDPAHMEYIRRNWPFLRDRRIDAYGEITKRYRD